jgi:hypothetical protein
VRRRRSVCASIGEYGAVPRQAEARVQASLTPHRIQMSRHGLRMLPVTINAKSRGETASPAYFN